jgi:hypothetical protein
MNKTQEVFRILQNYFKKLGWMFSESNMRFKRGESEPLAVRRRGHCRLLFSFFRSGDAKNPRQKDPEDRPLAFSVQSWIGSG